MNRRSPIAVLALLALLLGACSGAPAPVLEPLRQAAKTPVVLVPGITGTALVDQGTGKVAWGTGARILTPHDGAYAFVRPVDGSGGTLVAGDVIASMRLAFIKKEVYGPIGEMLEVNGYRRGDLGAPRPDDTLFLFGYDWRLSNEKAVAELAAGLERLRRARGEETLEVDLICQSNGAHICRYLAKYGGASFDEAEKGARRPDQLQVRKIVLAGTSNGGSLRILREIDRGRSYIALVGRKMLPEVLFTLPALYQDLPSYLDRYFLDENGKELDVDLYDPAAWQEHGWSIFNEKARRRVAGRPDLFGREDDWLRFLGDALKDAQRLQKLLHQDAPGFGATRYYSIQNERDPTPARAVLARQQGRWKLFFTDDRFLKKNRPLDALASTKGDGHASVESQRWLSPQERAALARDPFNVKGDHFELILETASLRRLLQDLHD